LHVLQRRNKAKNIRLAQIAQMGEGSEAPSIKDRLFTFARNAPDVEAAAENVYNIG
jgi:hypothetical protein